MSHHSLIYTISLEMVATSTILRHAQIWSSPAASMHGFLISKSPAQKSRGSSKLIQNLSQQDPCYHVLYLGHRTYYILHTQSLFGLLRFACDKSSPVQYSIFSSGDWEEEG